MANATTQGKSRAARGAGIPLEAKRRAAPDAEASARLIIKTALGFPADDAGQRKAVEAFKKAYMGIGRALPPAKRAFVLGKMATALAETIADQESRAAPKSTQASRREQLDNDQFFSQLQAREQAERATDISTGKLLDSAEMAARLGLKNRQAITAAVRANRMFTLIGPGGAHFYPAFFADQKYDRRVLEKVSQALDGLPGSTKWNFFTTPKFPLNDQTPLMALAKGKVDEVMALAKAMAQS